MKSRSPKQLDCFNMYLLCWSCGFQTVLSDVSPKHTKPGYRPFCRHCLSGLTHSDHSVGSGLVYTTAPLFFWPLKELGPWSKKDLQKQILLTLILYAFLSTITTKTTWCVKKKQNSHPHISVTSTLSAWL